MGRHVLSTSGFLDDSGFNRTFWMVADNWPGYYIAHRAAKTGQLLVVGPERTYGFEGFPTRDLQSPTFAPGRKGYLICADDNNNEPVLDDKTRQTPKGWGYTRRQAPAWFQWTPVRVRAMVLAGGSLFIAGPPDVMDPGDPTAAFEGRKGALLWTLSAADGKKLAECKLETEPVFDGLIATGGRLYMSTVDGRIVCLGQAK